MEAGRHINLATVTFGDLPRAAWCLEVIGWGKRDSLTTLNRFVPGARSAGVTVEEQPRGVGSLIRQLLWPLGMNSPAGKSQPGLRFLC